jgi:hypothetical protein
VDGGLPVGRLPFNVLAMEFESDRIRLHTKRCGGLRRIHLWDGCRCRRLR